jgi:hypothetical protein
MQVFYSLACFLFPLVSVPAETQKLLRASRLKCDKLLLDMIYNVSTYV